MGHLTLGDGTIIRYTLLNGDLSKPYLVFLHEGLGCIEMWRKFPQQLCRRTQCPGLVYDRCGYGGSSPERNARDIRYLHEYALKELPGVIESLIPHKDHILVGHSDGASIALLYGAEGFPRLCGLIAEAPHVFVEKETIRGIRLADDIYDRNGPGRLQKYHGSKTHAVFKSWSDTWLSERFATWNIEANLPLINCPILVVQGENDEYGTVKQVEAIASQVKENCATHIIKDCGHTPHKEQSALLLDLLSDFIGRLIA